VLVQRLLAAQVGPLFVHSHSSDASAVHCPLARSLDVLGGYGTLLIFAKR